MSRTYHLGCVKCRKSLWIGQGHLGGSRYLYGGDNHKLKLQRFMFEHLGHELIFDDSEKLDDYENEDDELDGEI